MQQHPGALNSDLEVESEKGPRIVETWGPSTGWYLTIMAFIFALLGFIASFKLQKPVAVPAEETIREKPREIVFKPITDEDTSVKAKPEKAIVKFETIGMQ
jgi:hypothetical protein